MEYSQILKGEETLLNCDIRGSLDPSATFRRALPPRIFIPQSPMTSDRRIKGIMIKLHLGGEKVARHLLWHLLFKGIKVTEWFLLYEYLSRNIKGGSKVHCACLFGALSESASSRKRVDSFTSTLRPIHKDLRAIKPKLDDKLLRVENTLELITKILNVPHKGLPIDKLITVSETSVIVPRPRDLSRIGVGYKDKGSFGVSDIPESVTTDEILSDSHNNFEESSLLDFWRDSLYPKSSL